MRCLDHHPRHASPAAQLQLVARALASTGGKRIHVSARPTGGELCSIARVDPTQADLNRREATLRLFRRDPDVPNNPAFERSIRLISRSPPQGPTIFYETRS